MQILFKKVLWEVMKGKICRTSGTVPEMQENLTSIDTQCFPRLAGTT